MGAFLCDDGNAAITIEATSARAAAQQYVDTGDWGEVDATCWIRVYVQPLNDAGEDIGEQEEHAITLEPDEPQCRDGRPGDGLHEWESPHEVVGGLRENPGVYGHGGGVIITRVCALCGRYRVTDTWATDRETGEQGKESVSYRSADGLSRGWIQAQEEERLESDR